MKTALATDEPDEPERKAALTAVASTLNYAAGGQGTTSTIYTYPTTAGRPPTTTATFPQRVVGPWQCPDCKTWMGPTVAEHRCP